LSRRSNKDRVAAPSAPLPNQGFASGLDFTRPTEFVQLPTEGKFYPEGHPLHLVTEVEITYMSAREEDILTSRALITKGVVLDKLIQSVLVDKTVDITTLYPGDKNAILVATRATGYGPEYISKVKCEACGTVHDHIVDLTNLPVKEVPQNIVISQRGTFAVSLPVTGFTVELKILNSREQQFLENLSTTNRKNNLPETNRTSLLKTIIVAVNGIDSRAELDKFIHQMPAQDSRFLKKTYDEANPTLDMTQEITCPNCSTLVVREVPLGLDFFWPS